MQRFTVFDRHGSHLFDLAEPDVLGAVWSQEINGEDSITLTCKRELSKGWRVVWRDARNAWHEHVVGSADAVHDSSGSPLWECWCELSSCDLRGDYVVNKRPGVGTGGTTAASALRDVLEHTLWEPGTVDVGGKASASLYHMSAWDALKEVVDAWGGELEATYDVDPASGVVGRRLGLRAKLGNQDPTRRFEWGRDLTSIHRTVSEDDIYTAVYAWGKGEELEGGTYGRRIGIDSVTPDGLPYVHNDALLPMWGRADGGHVFGEVVAEDCEDPEELMAKAYAYLEEHSGPTVSYTADVVQYGEAGADLHGISLGDAVQVVDRGYPGDGLRVVARAVKIVTDLLDPGNPTVTLGNFIPSIDSSIVSLKSSVKALSRRSAGWDAVQSASGAYVEAVIERLNALFASSGGFVDIDPATGITVTDKADPETSTMAVNISGAGIRIANSKTASGDWHWRTFGTGDGFTADEITAGTLKAGRIEDALGLNWWDLDNSEFHLSALSPSAVPAVWTGKCVTPASTVAKVATLDAEGFELKDGAVVVLQVQYTNSAASPTLDVGGTGAYPLYINSQMLTPNTAYNLKGSTWTTLVWGNRTSISSVKAWNIVDSGTSQSANSNTSAINTLRNTVNSNKKEVDDLKTQEAIFNLLTSDGAIKGLFMQSGQLYINGTYIAADTLQVDRIKTDVDGSYVKAGSTTYGNSLYRNGVIIYDEQDRALASMTATDFDGVDGGGTGLTLAAVPANHEATGTILAAVLRAQPTFFDIQTPFSTKNGYTNAYKYLRMNDSGLMAGNRYGATRIVDLDPASNVYHYHHTFGTQDGAESFVDITRSGDVVTVVLNAYLTKGGTELVTTVSLRDLLVPYVEQAVQPISGPGGHNHMRVRKGTKALTVESDWASTGGTWFSGTMCYTGVPLSSLGA